MPAVWYGGDWNPEQWPEPVWDHDLALMREAGVNLVTVGVFAWARLEPAPGRYTFDWLDRVLAAAHAAGIAVNLATPTASPPPWFSLAHPDALPVTAEGVRLSHGSRDTYCAAAPAYRDAARGIATALADRYAGHPALAMWHVHNEYGTICHCTHGATAFRHWLRDRYADLDALNQAWGTSFWSQHYTAWEQVLPPRATRYLPNPHQVLDFRRFWSDELLAAFRDQRDLLRAANPGIPVTTNFAFGGWVPVDHRRWATEVDLVALDAYPAAENAESQTAFLADLARHWGGERGWVLMEQSPGTLGHGRVHVAKQPGQLARLSLSYLGRGSRGVMFFQWRASAAGAEQFHSALVPHAGPDSRIFTEARQLGAVLPRLAGCQAGTVVAEVAIAWDTESWWALQQPHLPSDRLDYLAALHRAYHALWTRQVTVDFTHLASDLSPYRLLLVPSHYLADDAVADAVRRYVTGGGHLVVWYFSGIADRHGRVRLGSGPGEVGGGPGELGGGYPGAFREVLGVRVEEFQPLPPGASVTLSDGTPASLWTERLRLCGAEAVLRYGDGMLSGLPAVTRHRYGRGTAWYVSAELADAAYARLVDDALAGAGVAPGDLPSGVEQVERREPGAGGQTWRFLLNHTGAAVEVPATGLELVSGAPVTGRLRLEPGGFAVVRSDGSDRPRG